MSVSKLKREAERAATFRGHTLGPWTPIGGHFEPVKHKARCQDCEAAVWVTARPMPNEVDIAGRGVAVGCGDAATIPWHRSDDGTQVEAAAVVQNGATVAVWCTVVEYQYGPGRWYVGWRIVDDDGVKVDSGLLSSFGGRGAPYAARAAAAGWLHEAANRRGGVVAWT